MNRSKKVACLAASLVVPLMSVVENVSVVAAPMPIEAAVAVQPNRVLDTRSGRGVVMPGVVVPVVMTAASAAGASSVVLNLTATEAGGSGWVKAWPCGEPIPATSALNFSPDRTVANAVVVKLSPSGVCLATSAPVQLIVDSTGWFVGEQDFVGSTPNRVVDTRTTNEPLLAGQERRLVVAGGPGIGANATLAAVNITVDRPAAAGWVVAYPCGQTTNGSTVNFSAGEIVANFTLVGLSQGAVCLRSSVNVPVVIDSYGWSTDGGQLKVQTPSRLLDTRNPTQWPSGSAASGATVEVRIAGRTGVPNDADAAVINVTVANPASTGFVTVWPCDQPFPTASTLNTWSNALRSNLAVVKLSRVNGSACLSYRSSNGTPTGLVIDVVGWLTGGPDRSAPSGVDPVSTAPPTTAVPPPGVLWSESFGAASSMDRMIFQVTNQIGQINASLPAGGEGGNPPQSFNGDHNHACQAPSTTRTLVEDHTPQTHVWYCAPAGPESGHFMTAVNTGGYVIVAFSPKAANGAAMIFPATANRICWDQNITDLGGRKWTQLIVVSDDRYNANSPALTYTNPDNAGNQGTSPVGEADDFIMANSFNMATFFVGTTKTAEDFGHVFTGLADKAARYRMCVTDNKNGTVTRTQARPGGVIDTVSGPGSFPAGPRVFILSDDSYNPDKFWEDSGDAPPATDLYTWHWDNISIETM